MQKVITPLIFTVHVTHGSDNSPVCVEIVKRGRVTFWGVPFSLTRPLILIVYALFEIEYHAVGDTWWQPLVSYGK